MDIWTRKLGKKRYKGFLWHVLAFAQDILSLAIEVFKEIKFSTASSISNNCDICLSTKRKACNKVRTKG
jgi:hypothetical protein